MGSEAMQKTYVLGINAVYHETSAALFCNGDLVTCMEEERLSRRKHGKAAHVTNGHVLPFLAIEFCLKKAGISFEVVDLIGTSLFPEGRMQNVGVDDLVTPGGWGTVEGETLFAETVRQIPERLDEHFGVTGTADKFHWLSHHVTHGASAFLASPYLEAAVISVDGIGEFASTWIGHGSANRLEKLAEINYPNSLGFLWEKFSTFFGFTEHDACKVMGLASFGTAAVFAQEFGKLVTLTDGGGFTVRNDIMKFRIENDFTGLETLFCTPRISCPAQLKPIHEHIATGLQKVTNEVILHVAAHARMITGSRNLCLAGGVALNCVANTEILRSGLFDSVFVQPAAHDAGTALGAALYIWNTLQGHPRQFVMSHSFTAASYTDAEIESVLVSAGLDFELVEDIGRTTAELLAQGDKIIGWFQGGMEFGPRALGHRSLLADPRNPEMKEILNERIKKREPFRPFAPSVLAEHAADWFEIPTETESESMQYMLFAFPVAADKLGRIPAVTHVDGTSRIQVVRKEKSPKYHELISEFYRLTQVPMLLNTSFNDNEPIVCSPQDAVSTFQRARMDYLVLNNFLVKQSAY